MTHLEGGVFISIVLRDVVMRFAKEGFAKPEFGFGLYFNWEFSLFDRHSGKKVNGRWIIFSLGRNAKDVLPDISAKQCLHHRLRGFPPPSRKPSA